MLKHIGIFLLAAIIGAFCLELGSESGSQAFMALSPPLRLQLAVR